MDLSIIDEQPSLAGVQDSANHVVGVRSHGPALSANDNMDRYGRGDRFANVLRLSLSGESLLPIAVLLWHESMPTTKPWPGLRSGWAMHH